MASSYNVMRRSLYNPADAYEEADETDQYTDAPQVTEDGFGVSFMPPSQTAEDKSYSENGLVKARHTFLQTYHQNHGNKGMTLEESTQALKLFERPINERRQKKYTPGYPIADDRNYDGAVFLKIGLVFLPGADKPQVTQLEQYGMSNNKEPDQKDANWRFNTAEELLKDFEVGKDLQYEEIDRTAQIAERAHERINRGKPNASENVRPSKRGRESNGSNGSSGSRSKSDQCVVIDSDNIKIVNDLRGGEWDVEATLIEVDQTALVQLLLNYKAIIQRSGPNMTFARIKELLEIMVEDARRLCVRSPILFRMSTRSIIMNSKNTRFGTSLGPQFKTFTTSKGIREIIYSTAAYYNSLDPEGSKDKTQKMIRPRFLQMLVVLLSLLNDDDLEEIKDFMESTYQIKADRHSLELLILKVIPLLSINSRVFLEALIRTIDNCSLPAEDLRLSNDELQQKFPIYWDRFVRYRLRDGYIIPGVVDDLGRENMSWCVKWPAEGLKDSMIFNNMQFAQAGCALRTMNEIPALNLYPEKSVTTVSIMLSDGSVVTIRSTDLEPITLLLPGAYAVTDSAQNRSQDLKVQQIPVNDELTDAMQILNSLVHKYNRWLEAPKATSRMLIKRVSTIGRNPAARPFLEPLRSFGPITKNVATYQRYTLAVAFKLNGRKITPFDAAGNIAEDIQRMWAMAERIDRRAKDEPIASDQRGEITRLLQVVRERIQRAEQLRREILDAPEMADEPILRTILPAGADPLVDVPWFKYEAWFTEHNGMMQLQAVVARVTSLTWVRPDLIEVSLFQHPNAYHVAPLQEVQEGERNDELQENDLAVLAGSYMLIVVAEERSNACIMTNSLRIINAQPQGSTRRGRNRTQPYDQPVLLTVS